MVLFKVLEEIKFHVSRCDLGKRNKFINCILLNIKMRKRPTSFALFPQNSGKRYKRSVRKPRRMKHLDAFFLLNWKKTILIVAVWILAVFIHTAIFNLYMIQEWISFLISILVIPAYLVTSIVYTLDFHRRKR